MKHALVVVCVLLAGSCVRTPTWEALPLGTSAEFRDLWFTDANHGWIVGGSYQIVGGLLGRTEDGGKTWRYTSNLSRDRMSVLALQIFDSGRALLATDNGAILSTTDGGEQWAAVGRRGRVNNVDAADSRRRGHELPIARSRHPVSGRPPGLDGRDAGIADAHRGWRRHVDSGPDAARGR